MELEPVEAMLVRHVGEDGAAHRPVMLHRAVLGSMERFIVSATRFGKAVPG